MITSSPTRLYVQADPAADLGNLNSLSLTEAIIETGIHDAIARRLNEKGKLSRNAIAEAIINNVRKTIIRDQLTDPRFYSEMSKLLDDLIKQSRDDAAAYEEFLKRAEELETVAAAFRKLKTAGTRITKGSVNQVVRAALLDAFAVFEGYMT